MTTQATKNKNITKKSNVPRNEEFETFLKNQQNNESRLKKKLKSLISEVHLSHCGAAEKDKCLLELEHSIKQREDEIHKLSVNLDNLKEENSQILQEFNFFKEKFYQLEIEYDRNLNQQKLENENMLEQLQKQQTNENQEIQELSLKCQDLQQKLQNTTNDSTQLYRLHMEKMQNLEQMKRNFEQQQKEFEIYKNQVNQEKKLYDEKNKLDFDNLKNELMEKDKLLKQCISDKNELEKAKDLLIVELNNKIHRIEMAFSQPTKVVQPMVTLPQQVNNLDNNSNSESSNENNEAISKTQLRKPLENITLKNFSNNENQQAKQNQTQRNYKFSRPVQPATSSQQSNVVTNIGTNRKRRNQPLRQSSAVKVYNEFSLSSSDEDDDDSNYNSFSQPLWRPNKDCYVPDTDASEGFAKPKRVKK